MKTLLQYLSDVRSEFTHIKWPATPQAIGYTALVVVISILVAALLGAFDFIFTFGVEEIINRF